MAVWLAARASTDVRQDTARRLDPLAVLLPAGHPLAGMEVVPLRALSGTQVDASVDNENAPEWVDFGVRLLTEFGIEPPPPHPHADADADGLRKPSGTYTATICPS